MEVFSRAAAGKKNPFCLSLSGAGAIPFAFASMELRLPEWRVHSFFYRRSDRDRRVCLWFWCPTWEGRRALGGVGRRRRFRRPRPARLEASVRRWRPTASTDQTRAALRDSCSLPIPPAREMCTARLSFTLRQNIPCVPTTPVGTHNPLPLPEKVRTLQRKSRRSNNSDVVSVSRNQVNENPPLPVGGVGGGIFLVAALHGRVVTMRTRGERGG